MILRAVLVLVSLGALVHIVTIIAVVLTSKQMRALHGEGMSITKPVDAAIVLGGGTAPDGMPSYSTRRRVAAGVKLLTEGKAKLLILSGGYGNRNRSVPQGEKMRQLAISYGANQDQLLVEGRAISTFQNLLFSYPIAEEAGAKSLAIVTDPFHLYRAYRLSAFFGHPDVSRVAAKGQRYEHWLRTAFVMNREALSWWFNILKATGWEGMRLLGYSEADRIERIR
ncbi:MAG: YdcF family protein [Pseudomonadota bacterium]